MEECKQGIWLSGLLDKELTEEVQVELRQHLQKCPRCRELLGELKAMERCLGAVPTPCSVVWEALWQAVAQELVPPAKGLRRWPASVLGRLCEVRRWFVESRSRWAVAVAASILALLVGLWGLTSILPGGKPGPLAPGPSGGGGAVALASADALDVEIDQSEGEPSALVLVSADGKVAVVWVMSDQPAQAAPGI